MDKLAVSQTVLKPGRDVYGIGMECEFWGAPTDDFESSLLRPVFYIFFVKWRPLLAKLIITAAKEDGRSMAESKFPQNIKCLMITSTACTSTYICIMHNVSNVIIKYFFLHIHDKFDNFALLVTMPLNHTTGPLKWQALVAVYGPVS